MNDYELLVPNDEINNKAEDAMEFAISNEKINNLAVTGPYSSGKSSVIKTYFNKHPKLKYLNISLATFKGKNNTKKSDKSNSIEKAIIEKLYYSILRKKEYRENILTAVLSFLIVFFINLGVVLLNKESIIDFFSSSIILSRIFLCLEIILMTCVVSYVITYLLSLSKASLKIGNIELELNANSKTEQNKNLLSDELDFIIKIMNFAKYEYIIFEDLDRFNNTLIFERLRDLNIVLNTTLKKKVKFIYAIKDDMFAAENRTKFFDFIIPVVPYVSFESSGEELLKIIKNHGLEKELSEEFILNISLYISDMRILKNTVNEYIVYENSLEKKVPDSEKLFAILLYKNTCSKDFAKLERNEGNIYKIFKEKSKYIERKIKDLEEKILEYEQKIESYENILIDENLFKYIMLTKIFERFNSYNSIEITTPTVSKLALNKNMKLDLIPNDIISNDNVHIRYYNGQWYEKTFSDFFKTEVPYLSELYEKMHTKYKLNKEICENEIKDINNEINTIREKNLVEILEVDETILDILKDSNYEELTKYLLRSGYIEENYIIYMNKFHEGSITLKDYNFIMSVRNKISQLVEYRLDNPNKIIKRLKGKEFKREEILNIYILNSLLDNSEFMERLNIFLNTLIKSDRFISFTNKYIEYYKDSKNTKDFLNQLCKIDKKIWLKIKENLHEIEKSKTLIEKIFLSVNINHIKQFEELPEMIAYIEKQGILQNIDNENVKEVISKLDIHYDNISKLNKELNIYNFIVENNFYKINYINIETILNNTIEREKDRQYEEISKIPLLKAYIDDNIQLYIDNVFLKLNIKQNDSLENIKELINNPNIAFDSKKAILQNENRKLDNLKDIEDIELWDYLFEKQLIQFNLENIELYFKEKGLTDIIINNFNRNIINKDILKKEKSHSELLNALLTCDKLSINVYNSILENVEIENLDIEIDDLSEEKVQNLIRNKKLNLSEKTLQKIRDYSIKMLIEFIKYNYTFIHNKISNGSLIFTIDEIDGILSSKLTESIQLKSICMIKNEDIENLSFTLINNIALILIRKKEKNKINYKLLLKILQSDIGVNKKIELLNLNFGVINIDNITECLKFLGEDYEKILINMTKPQFKDSIYNLELINNIKNLGYNIRYTKGNGKICLTNTIRKKEK